jgi:hypothetical protein
LVENSRNEGRKRFGSEILRDDLSVYSSKNRNAESDLEDSESFRTYIRESLERCTKFE